jgi:hypothetical protein
VAGADDSVSFAYPYSFVQSWDGGSATATPDLTLGKYSFIFGHPIFNNQLSGCEEKGEPIYFQKGSANSYDDCWSLSNNFDETPYVLGTSNQEININDLLGISYEPLEFAHRVHVTPEGATSYYDDDLKINYVITIKGVSKALSLEEKHYEKVTLGTDAIFIVRAHNAFCGGTGGLSIQDNAVILNQWFINTNLPITYTDCQTDIIYGAKADKLGRHDVTVKSYFDLPFKSSIESPTSTTFSYEVVREEITQPELTFGETSTGETTATLDGETYQYYEVPRANVILGDNQTDEFPIKTIFIVGIGVIAMMLIFKRMAS